ncbi:Bacteriophytochrome (light-regulated signal transduction histidine kinase) [Cnuella takakiae]|uniref:histidine kinase n=1 Tax=Cnuella takakiae TaxID=1302690 RepID=A0A1M4T039_9BACT|nr:ATP-binding protein [Cnuella takakiae]OLY90641.1 hypothetical protein BUE76_01020 [Cnuella takakiae]SHE37657.1 Bacteriophytochrome (light-regulated signal transduction histidine kinase) [Cnuella takakiae]
MNLRDVSIQGKVTLTNCESEPIHIPGAIQPHGVLIALDEQGSILFCSANCHKAFDKDPKAILKQKLSDLDPSLEAQISAIINQDRWPATPFEYHGNNEPWTVLVHQSGDLFIVELEARAGNAAPLDLFDQTHEFVRVIERSRSLRDLCQRIAEQTRRLSGYDRVMIYKFDRDYNGQVFAESRKETVEPFLDLHYPHTDIPAQARELYLRNPMRMIADVNYEMVPLLTTEDCGHTTLDLGEASLRSVSPIHIQYLKNMGVGATLTVSLITEGKLWGLITCHHYSAKILDIRTRNAVLLQGHFLTSQIKVREVAEEYEVHRVVEAHLQQLLHVIPQDGDFHIKFESFSSLLGVANASGAAILHNGKVYTRGLVPSNDKIQQLFNWLASTVKGMVFSTTHLVEHYLEGDKLSKFAAGIIYHKLGNPKRDAVIWFREEMEQTINWAGDPNDAVKKVKEHQLTPRSSFAIFKEQVRYYCRDWKISELNAATRFASALQNQFHLEYLLLEEAQQRLLNEKLTKANKELANINWITSHDLKEPLRKILIFTSKVMMEEGKQLSDTIINSLNRIEKSALRMQMLVNDITTYTFADDKQHTLVTTDLNTILAEVIAVFEEEMDHLGIRVVADPLPHVRAMPFQMRQLFNNLIGNAIKFAQKGKPLVITIQTEEITASSVTPAMLTQGKVYHLIEISDNGIGFDSKYSDKLFDIFYRLHDQQSYSGTGMGLAICKRIVENHDGAIIADGQTGVGASFQIFLPKY